MSTSLSRPDHSPLLRTTHLHRPAVSGPLSRALLAQCGVDLPHDWAALHAVLGIQHRLREVTHEPQDDGPHGQGSLGE